MYPVPVPTPLKKTYPKWIAQSQKRTYNNRVPISNANDNDNFQKKKNASR